MHKTKILGNFGEKIAVKYLIKHGYRVVARNVQSSNQEIDIIAKQNNIWIFIEVKTSASSNKQFLADSYLKKQQLTNLKKIINRIIRQQDIPNVNARVDLIAIHINTSNKIAKIKHYFGII